MILSRRSMLFMPAVVAAANLAPVHSIERFLGERYAWTGPYFELLDAAGNIAGLAKYDALTDAARFVANGVLEIARVQLRRGGSPPLPVYIRPSDFSVSTPIRMLRRAAVQQRQVD